MQDQRPPLKILITHRDLSEPGGSEWFTIEMALAMHQRGHDVRVHAPGGADGAGLLKSRGIHVDTTLDTVPWTPDIIHGQHHLQAFSTLVSFTTAPMLYYSHGSFPWVEHPPLHGRIYRYAVMSKGMMEGMETFYGIPRHKVAAIGNYVDLNRFTRVRNAHGRPTCALLFGNNIFSPQQLAEIELACSESGIRLDKMGRPFGNSSRCPQSSLADYDIVFAIGRCAIEAMASGCAVIPVSPELACSLVTPDNFDHLAASNFAPRHYSPEAMLRKEWIKHQIAAFDPVSAAEVTGRVRGEFGMDKAADALENLYFETVALHKKAGPRPAADELLDMKRYLAWIGPETDRLWANAWNVAHAQIALEGISRQAEELARCHENITRLTDQKKDALTNLSLAKKRWSEVEKYLKKGPLRRHYLRRIMQRFNAGMSKNQPPAPEV